MIALIPAHNEEDGIETTVRSLWAQTIVPDRVIVMADNCTDRTVELARAAGAEVEETVDNTAKKAGPSTRAYGTTWPTLPTLTTCSAWMPMASWRRTSSRTRWRCSQRDDIGGLSGAIMARGATNFVELAQAIEYARGTRQMSRQIGRVHVPLRRVCHLPGPRAAQGRRGPWDRIPGSAGPGSWRTR